MGTRPLDIDNVDFSVCEGPPDLNGVDFWWDEEEGNDCVEEQPGCVDTDSQFGNCWSGNLGFDGQAYTSDPPALLLPGLPGAGLLPAGQLGEAGDARAVRDVASDRQPGPAGLRLVHHAARAPVGGLRRRPDELA